jgi:glycosyltransferase involved in cell wall biosynthesis
MSFREKIVVCGPIKNGARYIVNAYKNLNVLSDVFDVSYIIYENDSTDSTVSAIRGTGMGLISETIVNNVPRTVAIAHARNTLVKKILEKYSDYDYMLMVDLDGPAGSLNTESIPVIIDQYRDVDWAGLSAVSDPYYDVWALRCDNNVFGKVDYDCWHEIKFKGGGIDAHVTDNQITVNTPELIPVKSAFNGACIYKMEYVQPKYCGWHDTYGEQADHIGLHQHITNTGGKLYICPQLQVAPEMMHIRRK